MEQLALDVWPEFVEGIAAKAAEESKSRTDGCAVGCIVARSAPGVRKEISAGDCNQTGIGRHHASVAILRQEGHLGCVSDPMAEWRAFVPVVTRILAPNGAQPRFHGVTRRNSTEPHAVAVAKALPMWTVSPRPIEQRAPSGAEQSSPQAFRTNGAPDHPVDALAGRDWLARIAAAGGSRIVC